MCSKDCPYGWKFCVDYFRWKGLVENYFRGGGAVVKSKILGFHHSVCAQRKTGRMGGYILDLSFLLGWTLWPHLDLPSFFYYRVALSPPPASLPHQPLENKGNLKSTLVKNWKSEFNLTWFNLCSINCTSKGNYSYRAIH